MSIPTPSFFKIRLVLLIISFIVFCFLVGAVKNAFAEYPGECVVVQAGIRANMGYNNYDYQPTFDVETGIITPNQGAYHSGSMGTLYIGIWFYENNTWHSKNSFTFSTLAPGPNYLDFENRYPNDQVNQSHNRDIPPDHLCPTCSEEENALKSECGPIEGTNWEWTDEENCVGQCIIPCKTEKEQLTAKCGGTEEEAWKWTDKDSCEGECIYKDCTGPGEETLNEAKARCESDYSPGILTYYDAPQCKGVCGCLKADYISEKARCGKFGGIKYFSEVTCTATCGGCQELFKKVKRECEAQYGELKEFHCKDNNGTIEGTPTWLCDTNTKIPPDEGVIKPAPEPAPPDKTPEPDQPDNPNDPSDAKLGSIQKDLGKIIEQNNDRKNQLNKANNKLDWIGKNNKIIADNTKIIGDKLNDLDSGISDVNENIKGLSDDIGNIDKTLKDISKGSYKKPTKKDPYESEEHSFGDRTSDFLNQMKGTGLFSIANQLSTSIPGGGSPIFTIHTGDTFGGDHQIDFSNFSFALNMLKYLFQISGMVIAIRIVTLKR